MKHIKPYKIFESQELEHPGFPETEEEIHEICKKYNITNYTINEDLSIDVESYVSIVSKRLTYLPLNFNYVSGDFDCDGNNLKSLKGSPKVVGDSFYCFNNELTTLKGAPHTVEGNFGCFNNNLTSLKESPQTVGGYFSCRKNELTSLKGSPDRVGKYFNCSDNNIMSLEHIPSGIDYKYTVFNDNPIYSIVNTFIKKDNAEDLIQEFNDYDIVRGDKVILNRLKTFISDFDLDMPNLDEVRKHYKIV